MRIDRNGWASLLALCALLVAPAGCGSAPPQQVPEDESVRQPGVDVRRYDADLALTPDERHLSGTVAISVARPDTLSRLRLFLAGMTVDSVRVAGRAASYRRSGDSLIVSVPGGDTVSTVTVGYRGVPEEGLYRRRYAGEWVVFTDSWPTRARAWLPSVDVPSDPAALTLTLTVPAGYEAVANGVRRARRVVDGRVTTEWFLNRGAPTYSLAFAVSDFAPTSTALGDTLEIDYFMLAPDSAAASALERTPRSLAFLADRFGAYAYNNYQVVQVPIEYGGMENAALPFLQAKLFASGRGVESTQVHEAVHMWFGDRVVLARWRDLWLSEGVATYYTTLFYEEVDGRAAARRRWVRMVDIPPEELAGPTVLVPDRPVDPGEFLTWIPYQKGASVLHLIRRTVGDEAFFGALRRTYRRYRGRALSTPEFQSILETEAGRSLGGLFSYWVYGDSLPTLRVAWSDGTAGENPAADPVPPADADAGDGEASAGDRSSAGGGPTVRWSIEGDAGTLEGVPFELRISRGDTTVYVPASAGSYRFEDGGSRDGSGGEGTGESVGDGATGSAGADAPSESPSTSVRPVGILMRVDADSEAP